MVYHSITGKGDVIAYPIRPHMFLLYTLVHQCYNHLPTVECPRYLGAERQLGDHATEQSLIMLIRRGRARGGLCSWLCSCVLSYVKRSGFGV